VEAERESRDGTVKTLFRTADGHPVEAVLMRYQDGRRSLCLSSQSGCPLTCTFCAPGTMAFGRNLSRSEILDQALHFRRLAAVNDRYPIADIVADCRRHAETTRRRVFVEYVMLAGVNDAPEQARALAEILGRDHFKVNLIPYNPTGLYEGSSRERIAAFRHEL